MRRASFRSLFLVSLLSLASIVASADLVHVTEQVSLDGEVSQLTDKTLATGRRYETSAAPTKSGYRFTHWSISTTQAFSSRDDWGRAYDAAPYTLYEATTFTAHYVPATRDVDGDGLPDGWELYWFGDAAKYGAADDPDGDGVNNAAELTAGSNPLFPEAQAPGPVLYADGELWLYNPNNYAPYTFKSEPEGVLFATTTAYVKPGTKVTSGTYGTATAGFAYWKINGVAQRDDWGRALDAVSLAMPEEAVEIVAVTATGDSDGDGIEDRLELYWYGDLDETGASDTDGDGKTFAQELAAGTNPLMAEGHEEGPVVYVDGELWQYNPYDIQPYTVKSEPEGELFETTTTYVRKGSQVTSGTYGTATGFAYWKVNGVAQRDDWGRAGDSVSFAMPGEAVELTAVKVTGDSDGDGIADNVELYWYGDLDEGPDSDTDGDGKTFAEELSAGTNPLMAEAHEEGPVRYVDTEEHELNLQVYEQVVGALIENEYVQLFTSPIVSNNAKSVTFGQAKGEGQGEGPGSPCWPVVADVNGDGLWDLIVVSEATTNVFVNVGSKGNPQFANCGSGVPAGSMTLVGADVLGGPHPVDLAMNSTAKLAALDLDVEPTAALSATTNGNTMLVSDEDGRIWLYERGAEDVAPYQLRHKVWGGSYPGFAQGLRLAAVDWEDDGDLDCLCGTAEGKLMLLRDPKVGRPTGLVAEAGVDNVKLDWEPNGQSRVRGYRVYKATEATEGTEGTTPASSGTSTGASDSASSGASTGASDSASSGASHSGGDSSLSSFGSFTSLSQTSLPTYRDIGLAPATYAYKVSALSRFYTAGNSTPTVTESVATEPVTATVGGPTITIGEPVKTTAGKIEIVVSINNSMNYQAAGTTIEVAYDAAKIGYLKTLPSGLSEGLTWTATCESEGGAPRTSPPTNVVTIAITAGTVAAGSGVFFTLVFDDLGVERPILMGDLDGDGDVDVDDLRLLAKLKNAAGRKYTDYQLKAGDFNGNGKLDNADYQALRELLKTHGDLTAVGGE